MLLIKHDNGMIYTAGVSYNVFRNNSEAMIEAYDRDGNKIKTINLETENVEVEVK